MKDINNTWYIRWCKNRIDKRTYVEAEQFSNENVLRFVTSGKQRMAIFNGNSNTYGSISDSTGNGTVPGMMGGVAIGLDFNRPEEGLHGRVI